MAKEAFETLQSLQYDFSCSKKQLDQLNSSGAIDDVMQDRLQKLIAAAETLVVLAREATKMYSCQGMPSDSEARQHEILELVSGITLAMTKVHNIKAIGKVMPKASSCALPCPFRRWKKTRNMLQDKALSLLAELKSTLEELFRFPDK